MRPWFGPVFLLLLLAACAVGSGFCDDAGDPDGPVCLGDVEAPCDQHADCYSGRCVEGRCAAPLP